MMTWLIVTYDLLLRVFVPAMHAMLNILKVIRNLAYTIDFMASVVKHLCVVELKPVSELDILLL